MHTSTLVVRITLPCVEGWREGGREGGSERRDWIVLISPQRIRRSPNVGRSKYFLHLDALLGRQVDRVLRIGGFGGGVVGAGVSQMQKPARTRTDDDISQLSEQMGRYKFFRDMDPELRLEMCRVLELIVMPKDTVVYNEVRATGGGRARSGVLVQKGEGRVGETFDVDQIRLVYPNGCHLCRKRRHDSFGYCNCYTVVTDFLQRLGFLALRR